MADEPSPQRAEQDGRTPAQRHHDALSALLRSKLGDPALGTHRGLPVTVIVSTTLAELQSGAGQAVTAGGTLVPMRDVIRLASHAYHHLTIFDDAGRPLHLGKTKRLASADQRIVLHARDRGCPRPGSTAPGYVCEVHHVEEWAAGGRTDIDDLTFACRPDHRLLKPGGWKTRKHPDGTTEWIPPPQLPLPAGTNDYHHPEKFLSEDRR